MSRIVCCCSRLVETINDGRNLEFTADCEECLRSGGNFAKSSAWKEPDHDIPQLQKLGSRTSQADELQEKYPSKKQKGRK